MYHHRGAYLQALAMVGHTGLTPSAVHLWTLPMFHCNGWCFPWAVTAAAATHVCLPRVEPSEVWRLIREEGVTHLNGAPTVLSMLAYAPEAGPVSAARARRDRRCAAVPGDPAPDGRARLRRHPPLRADRDLRARDDLRLAPGVERPGRRGAGPAQGPAGRRQHDLLPGAGDRRGRRRRPGRRQSRSARSRCAATTSCSAISTTPGDDAAATEAVPDGWFRTGDLGVVHPDGYVELRDRSKDVIISGGENIASVEVEQAIVDHPAVLEVAVIAVPDERWGEVPAAFVTLHAGATADRGGDHRARPGPAGAVQGARRR